MSMKEDLLHHSASTVGVDPDLADNKKLMIYNSATINFNISVFIWEFLANLLYPISAFHYPVCHQMASANGIVVWLSHFNPIMIYICIIAYLMSEDLRAGQIFIPLMFYMNHRLMIACKYASLTPTEYSRVLTCVNQREVNIFQSQLQLLSGWLAYREDVIEFELLSSALKVGVNQEMHFYLPAESDRHSVLSGPFKSYTLASELMCENKSPLDIWKRFILEYEKAVRIGSTCKLTKCKDGRCVLSVIDMCKVLIQRAYGRTEIRASYHVTVLASAILMISVPFFAEEFYDRPSLWNVVYFLSSAYSTLVYYVIAVYFLSTPLIDTIRRLEMLTALLTMVRVSKVYDLDPRISTSLSAFGLFGADLENECEACVPMLDMNDADNVYAWLICRLVVKSFGERFRFRMDIYIAGYFLLTLVLMVLILRSLIVSEDPSSVIYSSLFIQSMLVVFVLMSLLVALIVTGALTNSTLRQQRHRISIHSIKTQVKWLDMKAKMSGKGEITSPIDLTDTMSAATRENRNSAMRRSSSVREVEMNTNPGLFNRIAGVPVLNLSADLDLDLDNSEASRIVSTDKGIVDVLPSQAPAAVNQTGHHTNQDRVKVGIRDAAEHTPGQGKLSEYEDAICAQNGILEMLENDDEIAPIKLFGVIPAEMSLALTLATSLVAFVTTVWQLASPGNNA